MTMNQEPDQNTFDEWEKDSNNWILGIFYFNKKDKRLFLPKRIKFLGWTLNFANPYSYLFLIGIIALIVILEKMAK